MASKIGNKYFNAQGLDGAENITKALAMMEATEAGADWDGGDRTDKYSNAQIVDFLADGGRDITPTKEDGNQAVKLYSNQLVKHLNRVGQMGKTGVITVEKQVTSGITAGLRDAAKYIAKVMYDRVKAGKDNMGVKTPVTKEYARQRFLKHGIADNVNIVFHATLQLANSLRTGQDGTGKIKVRFNKAGIGRAAKIFRKG